MLLAVLGFFIVAHGYQAHMGTEIMLLSSTPLLIKLVGFLYAGVNLGVVLAEMYLVVRAIKIRSCNRYITRQPSVKYSWGSKEMLTSVVVTLGGQLIFGAVYIIYNL
jgi:hypothetical protein